MSGAIAMEAQEVPMPAPPDKKGSKKKRNKKAAFKSRWDNQKKGENMGFNEPDEKIFTPMPFCYLPKNKTTTEIEILILRHRLEDLQKRLAVGDFEIIEGVLY